jgi:hypothetical protein
LLFLGDVQKELPHHYPVSRQIALEGFDVVKALVPDVLGNQRARIFWFASSSG